MSTFGKIRLWTSFESSPVSVKNVKINKFFIDRSYRVKLDRVIFHLGGNCLGDVLDVAYYVQNLKFQLVEDREAVLRFRPGCVTTDVSAIFLMSISYQGKNLIKLKILFKILRFLLNSRRPFFSLLKKMDKLLKFYF